MKKPKLPKPEGAKKAVEIFEKTKKKQPSDALIKIISEVSEKKCKPFLKIKW